MYALPIISTYEVLNLIFQVNIDSETHVHLPTMIKKTTGTKDAEDVGKLLWVKQIMTVL